MGQAERRPTALEKRYAGDAVLVLVLDVKPDGKWLADAELQCRQIVDRRHNGESPDHAVVSSLTVLAGQRYAIGTTVAVVTVPFPPVTTLTADLAMPRTRVLSDIVPAERVPVQFFAAARATVTFDQFPQRYLGMTAGQLHHRVQLIFSERFEATDILNCTDGQL